MREGLHPLSRVRQLVFIDGHLPVRQRSVQLMVDHDVCEREACLLAFLRGAEKLANEELVLHGGQNVLLKLDDGEFKGFLLVRYLFVRQWKKHTIRLTRVLAPGLVPQKTTLCFDEALHGGLKHGAVPVQALV